MNRREAEEALDTDPRDLTAVEELSGISPPREYLKLRELLQISQPSAFQEQAKQ
jgi:hypothetical protein